MLKGSFYFLHVDEEQQGAKLVRADNFGVTRAVGGLLHLAQHFHTIWQEAAKGKLKNEVVLSSVRVQCEPITSVWGKSSVAALGGLSQTLHAHRENAQRRGGRSFYECLDLFKLGPKIKSSKKKILPDPDGLSIIIIFCGENIARPHHVRGGAGTVEEVWRVFCYAKSSHYFENTPSLQITAAI